MLQRKYPVIGDVRGIGLMQAIEFTGDDGQAHPTAAGDVQQAAVAERLLLLTCGPLGNVVRVVPALTVSEREIDLGLAALDNALSTVTTK